MYAKMPFGLMSGGKPFQREMDIGFVEENDSSVVMYLDDITIFSKSASGHLKHLKQVFLKCRKYGISQNPKKYNFTMQEGIFGVMLYQRME